MGAFTTPVFIIEKKEKKVYVLIYGKPFWNQKSL